MSRLRATLRRLGIAPPFGIATDVGAYQFAIVDVWVDVEAARAALDLAEGALRRLDTRTAWASANVAVAIAAQPFLTTEDAPWIVRERR